MKNYQAGWAAAIDATNARVQAGTEALEGREAAPPEPENQPDAVIAERERNAAIVRACCEAGMSEHAVVYIDDERDVDEILTEIRSVHLTTDFTSHLGLDSEFKQQKTN